MTEAGMQTKFTKWLKRTKMVGGNGFELKITKGKRIAFSAIPEHQITALLDIEESILVHKISDSAIGYKPFDCFSLGLGCVGWFVLGYEGGEEVYMVLASDVAELIYDKKGTRRKGSIKVEWAREFGKLIEL